MPIGFVYDASRLTPPPAHRPIAMTHPAAPAPLSDHADHARPRARDIHEQHRVATPLEPLFDLSFVVAIALAASHLHHGVMEHHTGPALAGFVAAFVAIWCAWMNYT